MLKQAIPGVLLVILFIVFVISSSCSGVVDPLPATATPTLVYQIDPPETIVPTIVVVPLVQPKRYIDFQAEVVCYYTQVAISCVPGNQTKIFTYDLLR